MALRRLGYQVAHRVPNAGELGDGILFVNGVEADARHMPAQQRARPHQEIVEMLLDDAAQEMLAEIRDLGVLVDDEHASGLEYAAADGLPVVGENAPQIDDVKAGAAVAPQL